MNRMGRFSKHLDKEENYVEIENERYNLRCLCTESIPDFLIAAKAFAGMDKNDPDPFKKLDLETINSIKNMINNTLKKSFPDDWQKDPDELKQFGFKYMMVLLPKILEINSADKVNTHEEHKIQTMKSRLQNDTKSA